MAVRFGRIFSPTQAESEQCLGQTISGDGAVLEHRILVDVGQALLKREEGGWVLHHGRKDGLVVGPDIGIAHGRMLLVLDGCQSWLSRTHLADSWTNLRI